MISYTFLGDVVTELRYGGKTKMYWLRFGVRVSRVRLKSQLLLILREAGRAAHFESSPNPPSQLFATY